MPKNCEAKKLEDIGDGEGGFIEMMGEFSRSSLHSYSDISKI